MPIKEIKDMFLRGNFPYCLEINNSTKEVYYINRDYEYMGFNTKCLSDIREDTNNFQRTYVYDDGSKPWKSVKNYEKALKKINNLCKDKVIRAPIKL